MWKQLGKRAYRAPKSPEEAVGGVRLI